MHITWHDAKREANLEKHGLDFEDAVHVFDNCFRLDVPIVRGNEMRVQSYAYAFGFLAVLTVVHVARDELIRVISFRRASSEERRAYHEWLESDYEDL